MKKIIAIIVISALLVLMMCGWKFKSVKIPINIWIDTETGVEYVIYGDGARGGICPRYNADGTLRVNKE